jgi:hypothetical protein
MTVPADGLDLDAIEAALSAPMSHDVTLGTAKQLLGALRASAARERAYREALTNVSGHSAYLQGASPVLLSDLLTRCGEIARAALARGPE